MNAETLKVSCILEGDSAFDFERIAMVLKVQTYAQNRQKQQAVMVSASMLAFDALIRRFIEETGKRYPTMDEVLSFAGCRESDIDNVLRNGISR